MELLVHVEKMDLRGQRVKQDLWEIQGLLELLERRYFFENN